MHFYPAALSRLLLPVIVVGAALWARAYLDALGSDARVVLDYLPYLLCLVAALVAYQFNRCRLLLAALGVALFYWQVQRDLQVSLAEPAAARTYLALSLALPLSCFYLLLLPERGILNLSGLASAAGFALLALLVFALAPWLQQVNEAARSYYSPWPGEAYVLSRGATLLAALAAATGAALLCLRHEETEAALLGALLAQCLALALLYLEDVSVAMSTAAGLCLIWGVLRSSHAMAYRDELTGLPSRRALNERLKSPGRTYALAMLDVDHFKRFNDTHGHDVGDEVLRLVASRIRRVRGGTAYRYGGEEFCVFFPRRELEDCIEPLEQVREEIADYRMSLRNRGARPKGKRAGARRRGATPLTSDQVAVTISAGLAARSDAQQEPEAVLKEADRQLYRAKKAGRNRVAA